MAKTLKEEYLGNGLTVVMRESAPPPRYTEATLIKKLEATGSGRSKYICYYCWNSIKHNKRLCWASRQVYCTDGKRHAISSVLRSKL